MTIKWVDRIGGGIEVIHNGITRRANSVHEIQLLIRACEESMSVELWKIIAYMTFFIAMRDYARHGPDILHNTSKTVDSFFNIFYDNEKQSMFNMGIEYMKNALFQYRALPNELILEQSFHIMISVCEQKSFQK